MAVLNFHHTRRQAFAAGFMKGLMAPHSIYRTEPAPDLPPLVWVEIPGNPHIADALASDWVVIGKDLRATINGHVKKAGA
jgi:hypothetical protein